MPFTPYHFGPGLGLKAAAPRRLSFLSFATTQVAPVLRSELSFGGAMLGGLLGGLTHSVMDAIVHPDVQPFLPLSGSNPLIGLVEWNAMETACVVAGLAGIVATLMNRRIWRSGAGESRSRPVGPG